MWLWNEMCQHTRQLFLQSKRSLSSRWSWLLSKSWGLITPDFYTSENIWKSCCKSLINPREAGCCKNEGETFDDTCGVPSTSNLFSAGRSYGSINSGRKQWPWMVHIRYTESGENKMRLCGGAIISSRFVLTAAHCLAKIDFPCDNCIHAFVGLYNFRSGILWPIRDAENITETMVQSTDPNLEIISQWNHIEKC